MSTNQLLLQKLTINPYNTGANNTGRPADALNNGQDFKTMLNSAINDYGSSAFSSTRAQTQKMNASAFANSLSSVMTAGLFSGNTDTQGSNPLLSGGSDNNSNLMTMLMLMLLNQNGNAFSQNSVNTANNQSFNRFAAGVYSGNAYASAQNYSNTGVNGASDIPYDAWKVSDVSLKSSEVNRNPSLYRSVIDQFNVETNGRYKVNKRGSGDTYCNIFAWDVTRAMNAEIPHYTDKVTGEPMTPPNNKGGMAMTANRMNEWLKNYGEKYGWKKVSAEEAQSYANAGRPAITSWKNPGGHGHMQVVSPSKEAFDSKRGVAIAQAGRTLHNYTYASKIYGQNTLNNKLDYFVHA